MRDPFKTPKYTTFKKRIGKLVLLKIRGRSKLKFGVLEGFDIYGVLLGPKKGRDCDRGFYNWRDIVSVAYAKEDAEEKEAII